MAPGPRTGTAFPGVMFSRNFPYPQPSSLWKTIITTPPAPKNIYFRTVISAIKLKIISICVLSPPLYLCFLCVCPKLGKKFTGSEWPIRGQMHRAMPTGKAVSGRGPRVWPRLCPANILFDDLDADRIQKSKCGRYCSFGR